MKGRVRRYLTDKRYGFLSPLDGGKDVFFHLSVFDPCGGPPPIANELVTFTQLEEGAKALKVVRDVVPTHETGKITSYDPLKGYGFIAVEGGQRYLHKSEVVGGIIPAVGSMVHFYVTESASTGKSPRACYVAILS